MFDVGTNVTIILSQELAEMRLAHLAGITGVVTECKFDNHKNPGAFVQIKRGKFAGEEWFIPVKSLQSRESINRMRSKNILKTFKEL